MQEIWLIPPSPSCQLYVTSKPILYILLLPPLVVYGDKGLGAICKYPASLFDTTRLRPLGDVVPSSEDTTIVSTPTFTYQLDWKCIWKLKAEYLDKFQDFSDLPGLLIASLAQESQRLALVWIRVRWACFPCFWKFLKPAFFSLLSLTNPITKIKTSQWNYLVNSILVWNCLWFLTRISSHSIKIQNEIGPRNQFLSWRNGLPKQKECNQIIPSETPGQICCNTELDDDPRSGNLCALERHGMYSCLNRIHPLMHHYNRFNKVLEGSKPVSVPIPDVPSVSWDPSGSATRILSPHTKEKRHAFFVPIFGGNKQDTPRRSFQTPPFQVW